jgi:hypothetical protein
MDPDAVLEELRESPFSHVHPPHRKECPHATSGHGKSQSQRALAEERAFHFLPLE